MAPRAHGIAELDGARDVCEPDWRARIVPLRGFGHRGEGHTLGHCDGATRAGSSRRRRPARDASRQLQERTRAWGSPSERAVTAEPCRKGLLEHHDPAQEAHGRTNCASEAANPSPALTGEKGFPRYVLSPVPCGPAPSHAGDKVNDKRPPLSTWWVPGAALCPQHPCFPRGGTERRAWGPRRGTRRVAGCGPGGRRGPLCVKVSRGHRERSWGPENP